MVNKNKIEQKFENGKCFIPYISLGDPSYESSVIWANALIDGGADILELGIPFSDPVADGPVIQEAFKRSFLNGFDFKQVFKTTKKIHEYNKSVPLVYLTYFNPIYAYGINRFLNQIKNIGIYGLIIPDLPFNSTEAIELSKNLEKLNISIIHLVTPNTDLSRIKEIGKDSSGFIYYVTSFGVTGIRTNFSKDLKKRIELVKKITKLPVSAGFGISTPEQANEIANFADGVIIGSAVQKIIQEYGLDQNECAKKLKSYSGSITESIKKIKL